MIMVGQEMKKIIVIGKIFISGIIIGGTIW